MERNKDPSTLSPPSKRFPRIMEKLVCFIVLLCLSLSAVSAINRLTMNYSEVQELGSSCPRLDSCGFKRSMGVRGLDSVQERNCACDYLCEEFGDCCIDAPDFGNSNETPPTNNGWTCQNMRQFGNVYMRDTCSSPAASPEVEGLCHRSSDDPSDPLGSLPVTDSVTGYTYKNYYCGLCNGKNENLVIWSPRLECPTLTFYNRSRMNLTFEYVSQNLVFDGSSWGVYLDGDNGSLFFHECVIDPVIPELLESKIRLCRTQSVDSCPPDWNDSEVLEKCKAYTGLRYFHSESYRNVHCAMCNRVNLSLLTCQSVDFRDLSPDIGFRTFEPHAFSLLLDINEQKGGDVGYVKKCSRGEVFDPFFKKCRSLTCLPGYSKKGNECVPETDQVTVVPETKTITSTLVNLEPIISLRNDSNVLDTHSSERNASYVVVSEGNLTVTKEPEKFNESMGAVSDATEHPSNAKPPVDPNVDLERNIGRFNNCLLITLEEGDYVMYENETVYVPMYDKFYEPDLYFAMNRSLLVCSHFDIEPAAKFSPIMGYVTIIGLGISMVCLLLHCILFCLVPDLQNLSGKNLMSQCVALFCAYSFYIVGVTQSGSTLCTVVAFLTFFFFQSSFFWMNTMAFDVWRTLKMATTELRVTSGKQTKRFWLYSIYSWVMPLLVVGLAAVAEYTDVFPEEYRPRFAQPKCWFKHRRSLLIFFAVPLFAVIVSNILLFLSSARMIIMTTKTTIKQQSSSQRRNFTLYLRLFILMGLTWAVGVVAGYVDVDFLWYIFVVFNTFQGLFIFVAFTCSAKVLGYLRNKVSKFTKETDFRSSALHSSHVGTNSTSALSSAMSAKNSTRLLMSKNSASPTNSNASVSNSFQN